jgi:hypothetical protein
MAKTDNLDDFIKMLSKIEGKVDTAVIREARKNMRATIRKYKPLAKKSSPKDTGALIKSIKVKSRSRKGVSTVTLTYAIPYAGPQNFIKGGDNEKFLTDFYAQKKAILDRQGTKDVRDAFIKVLTENGIKVE